MCRAILGDGTNRGREIYDPATNAWYWLDSCYNGAKAVNKEVWIPYVYQDELVMSADGYGRISGFIHGPSEVDRLANQSAQSITKLQGFAMRCIESRSGKWVRYDEDGQMMKGWVTIEGALAEIYPAQAGNKYYYDNITGAMVKDGVYCIDGRWCDFNENGVFLGNVDSASDCTSEPSPFTGRYGYMSDYATVEGDEGYVYFSLENGESWTTPQGNTFTKGTDGSMTYDHFDAMINVWYKEVYSSISEESASCSHAWENQINENDIPTPLYTYDHTKLTVESTGATFDDDGQVISEYIRDEQGNLIKQYSINPNERYGKYKYGVDYYENTYDENGNRVYSVKYTYDANGELAVVELIEVDRDTMGNQLGWKSYSYGYRVANSDIPRNLNPEPSSIACYTFLDDQVYHCREYDILRITEDDGTSYVESISVRDYIYDMSSNAVLEEESGTYKYCSECGMEQFGVNTLINNGTEVFRNYMVLF